MQQCDECRQRFEQFDKFYSLFLTEILRPVTNSALDFAKTVGGKGIVVGLFECTPLLDKTNGQGFAYQANLVFRANGEKVPQKLSDYRGKNHFSQTLLLRAMSDPVCHKTLLFLQSPAFFTFKGWVLKIPGIVESVHLSPTGAAQIALTDLKKMGDKIIYLQKIDENTILNEKRLDKIKNSLAI